MTTFSELFQRIPQPLLLLVSAYPTGIVVLLLLFGSFFPATTATAAETTTDGGSNCAAFWPPANPLVSDEPMLADPHVLEHNNTLYLYPTSNEIDFVVYTKTLNDNDPSSNSGVFTKHETPVFTPSSSSLCLLRYVPGVGNGNLAWAPHVFRDEHGDENVLFYLYYTACLSVGVAVSDSPLGPFEDKGLLCRFCIDAFVWRDPKNPSDLYFYYNRLFGSLFHSVSSLLQGVLSGGGGGSKGQEEGGGDDGEENQNSRPHILSIYGTRMVSPTKLSFSSPLFDIFSHVRIVYPSADWEFGTAEDDNEEEETSSSLWSWLSSFFNYFLDFSSFLPSGVNEGAWLVYNRSRDEYILTYSGASANSRWYRLGFATAKHPLGPFLKSSSNPIIVPSDPSEIGIHGPGHHALWIDSKNENRIWAFYHAKYNPTLGWERYINVDELVIASARTCNYNNTQDTIDINNGDYSCEELSITLQVTLGNRSQEENPCLAE